jgi:hypothetical protein
VAAEGVAGFSWWLIVPVVATPVLSGLSAWLAYHTARRAQSGSIEVSAASELWASKRELNEDLQNEITRLTAREVELSERLWRQEVVIDQLRRAQRSLEDEFAARGRRIEELERQMARHWCSVEGCPNRVEQPPEAFADG